MNQKVSEYVIVARLWLSDYEKAIENNGVANTFSGPYKSIEDLHNDSVAQFEKMAAANNFEMDIPKEEAIEVLLGKRFLVK
jgi:hypothetical protein